MYIKEMILQHRRDFTAIYKCEHCGKEKTGRGYDDANFHQNVIPKMACKVCGKLADENYQPNTTRYPEGMQV